MERERNYLRNMENSLIETSSRQRTEGGWLGELRDHDLP
jgi:hypothetical protein